MKTVLITGARGATARYLAEYILNEHQADASVVEYNRTPVRGQRNLTQTVAHHRPDLIFHLAGRVKVGESFVDPLPFYKDNVLLTIELLEAVKRCAPRCRVLVASSCEVYGIPQTSPMTEDHPMAPVSPYGASKAAADLSALMYARQGLHVVVSRLFNLINPRASHLFSSQWAKQIAEIERFEPKSRPDMRVGNLSSARTLLDVRDVVRAYWMLLDKGEPGQAYNIGAPDETPLQDFLGMLCSRASVRIDVHQDPRLMRPIDLPTQIADSSKFLAATGWEPRHSLDDSVKLLLNHWRQHVTAR